MIKFLHDLIINANQHAGNKTAVFHNEEKTTYEEIYMQSLQLSQALRSYGIKKSDRVCFYLEKRIEKIVSIFGISMCGGIFVPIRSLSHIDQVTHIVQNCGAKILISTSARLPSILDHIGDLQSLEHIIIMDEFKGEDISEKHSVIPWESVISGNHSDYPQSTLTEKDIAGILYTSGSTGRPKGVALSHLNIVAGAKKVSEYLKINEEDRILSILTYAFDYGLNQLTTAFLKYGQIVLLDYLFPKDLFNAVDKFKITGLAAVATTWIKLLQVSWENTCMRDLRYITNSGGAIPVNYVRELRKRLPDTDIYLMYGLTEAFRSTFLDPSLVDVHPDSMGKAIPGEEILVLDENNQPVKPGQVGELVHRGTLVSQGYWGDSDATESRFKANPMQLDKIPIPETVVFSGDYVRVDEEGLLYFVGRKDEMIKCSGNRISPTEIEEVLYRSGMVNHVVVFGVPHEILGQSVYAVVSVSPEQDFSKPELIKYCRQHMPPFMIPGEIDLWENFPVTENGKIDRPAIKKAVFSKHGISTKM